MSWDDYARNWGDRSQEFAALAPTAVELAKEWLIPNPQESFNQACEQADILADSSQSKTTRASALAGVVAGAILTVTDLVPGVGAVKKKAVKAFADLAEEAATKTPVAKNVIIDGLRHPDSAGHAQDAIGAGVKPGGIIDRAGAKPRRASRLEDEPRMAGKDRDEFPPAMLDNGGGGHCVRPIAPGDNHGAGSSIRHQLNGVPNGTPVTITPINVPPKTP